MLYSVRMRSAEGGAHEVGGRHISGAERIVGFDRIGQTTEAMLQRAFTHTRGSADFINIVVEKIGENELQEVPLLSVATVYGEDITAGHQAIHELLTEVGITGIAVQRAMEALLTLNDSMSGAMLLCALTGQRLDDAGRRGIRVSRMDIGDEQGLIAMLTQGGIHNSHVREALVLASKVAAAPGVVAELCWSDDPEYTTGYVASPAGYKRIPHCKPRGSLLGGRVFFVKPDTDISGITNYLEKQTVIVTLSEK